MKKIAFIVHDISDSRVIKRIHAFKLLGNEIVVFGFHRVRYSFNISDYEKIPIINLGRVSEKNYFSRIFRIFRGIVIVFRNLDLLKGSDCIYTINIDMLFIGAIFKNIMKSRLFYEVGDILNPFLGNSVFSATLRKFEFFLLKFTDLAIFTSKAFYYNFYKPVQHMNIPWVLLENHLLPQNTSRTFHKNSIETKIKIVYHGVLRDERSIDILINVSKKYNNKCELHIHGYPLWIDENKLKKCSKKYGNIHWHGEYKYPDDLSEFLSDADLLWVIDLSENCQNSKWLLPNRLYDGIFFDIPMLALKNTETGKYIENEKLGWSLDSDVQTNFDSFIGRISRTEIEKIRSSTNPHLKDEIFSFKQYININNKI